MNSATTDSQLWKLSGIAVSPGVGIGTVLWLDRLYPTPSKDDELGAQSELQRFNFARNQVLTELEQEVAFVALSVGPSEASIVQSHVSMINDRAFIEAVRQAIEINGLTVTEAVEKTLSEYTNSLSKTGSEYFESRIADLRDVFHRVVRVAAGHGNPLESELDVAHDTPVILAAEELRPSHLTAIRRLNVVGIATIAGGRTSHAAILARAMGIPAISGLGVELTSIEPGARMVVDARHATVIVHPDDETSRKYAQEVRELGQLWHRLRTEPAGPAETTDGTRLLLMANVSSLDDVKVAVDVGANGIGLLRTEFYYLGCHEQPDEDSEFDYFREIVDAAPDGPLTIRTLDIGGDKALPYFSSRPEANPFLGWRSIRLSFERPEIFVQQIRAVLRTAYVAERKSQKEIRLLFPMVTVKSEWLRIQRLVDFARDSLGGDPDFSVAADAVIKMGVMIEVPAAALCIDHFLPLVDFVSIGTNDLVQYLTAADRDNPKVGHLCQVLSPPMLRLLKELVDRCNDASVPVSVCGEMGGSVRAVLPLVGMGFREFSMSPRMIPAIRDLVRHISTCQANEVYRIVKGMDTAEQIQKTLDDFLASQRGELTSLLIG